jgi:hypothetical protein
LLVIQEKEQLLRELLHGSQLDENDSASFRCQQLETELQQAINFTRHDFCLAERLFDLNWLVHSNIVCLLVIGC